MAENLVQIYHRGVLVGSYPQRLPRGRKGQRPADPVIMKGRRTPPAGPRPQLPVGGLEVIRMVDTGGSISFAGTTYSAGNRWKGCQVAVAVVGDTVQISIGQEVIKTHPIRHDRARELGAYATPLGHPARFAKKNAALNGVKQVPNSNGQTGTEH